MFWYAVVGIMFFVVTIMKYLMTTWMSSGANIGTCWRFDSTRYRRIDNLSPTKT